MLPLATNGYTSDQVLSALQAGVRTEAFRYDLLDSTNTFKRALTTVTGGNVANNALANIKRTAKFSLQDDGSINFLSDRIKPWYRLKMPELFNYTESNEADFASGTLSAVTSTSGGLQLVQVTNLVTNPDFETVTGTATVFSDALTSYTGSTVPAPWTNVSGSWTFGAGGATSGAGGSLMTAGNIAWKPVLGSDGTTKLALTAQATFVQPATVGNMDVVLFVDSNNKYVAYTQSGYFYIAKVVGGTNTTLASIAQTISASSSYPITLARDNTGLLTAKLSGPIQQQNSGNYTLTTNSITVSLAYTATTINVTDGTHSISYSAAIGTDRYVIDGVTKYFANEGGYVNSTGFKFWTVTGWNVGDVTSWTASGGGGGTGVLQTLTATDNSLTGGFLIGVGGDTGVVISATSCTAPWANGWTIGGDSRIAWALTKTNPIAGTYSVSGNNPGGFTGSVYQSKGGLPTNTAYTLSAYAKVSSGSLRMRVSNDNTNSSLGGITTTSSSTTTRITQTFTTDSYGIADATFEMTSAGNVTFDEIQLETGTVANTFCVGTVYASGGYRTSPPILSLGTIRSSVVSWTATTPANTSVGLQVSTDGGSTWRNLVNGGTLLSTGDSSDGIVLRENLSTTDTTQTPTLQSVTITGLGSNMTGWAEFPLGVFILSTPIRKDDISGVVLRDVEAYDLLQVLVDDKVITRYTVAAGAKYTDTVISLLSGAGITSVNIAVSNLTLPVARDWAPGTTKLQIINDLLGAINYRSLYFDANGVAVAEPYMTPDVRASEFAYADDELSVIFPGVEQTLDLFAIPNEWVLVVTQPDRTVLSSTYTNSNGNSPTSTVNRGRTIVDYQTNINAADQSTLDALAQRTAYEASQIYEDVLFMSAIMPMHADLDVLTLNYSRLGIIAKYVETGWSFDLVEGGQMQHTIRRTVSI